jgi:hypothetical protein
VVSCGIKWVSVVLFGDANTSFSRESSPLRGAQSESQVFPPVYHSLMSESRNAQQFLRGIVWSLIQMVGRKRSASRGFRGLTMGVTFWYTMYIMRKIIKKHDLDCPDFLQGLGLFLFAFIVGVL